MSRPGDFIIENGVLKEYKGPGGEVVIPDSVTSIGNAAFYGCPDLATHAPAGAYAEKYAKEHGIPFVVEE